MVIVCQRCFEGFKNNGDCAFTPHEADRDRGKQDQGNSKINDIPVRGRVEGFASVRGKDSVVRVDEPIPHATFVTVNR